MKGPLARVVAFLGCASLATAIAAPLLAQTPSPSPPPSPVLAEMTPIQGPSAPIVAGWNEFLVRLSNGGGKPERGQIQVTSHAPYGSNREYVSTAPFSIGAGAAIGVRVPAVVSQFTDVSIRVLSEGGDQIAERRFTPNAPNENVFLLDVDEPSLLRGVINEVPIAPSFLPSVGRAHGSGPELLLGSPRVDPATGDPVLPDRSALYGGTDVVLFRSDVLARVTGADLDALSGFVLSGGTIAIAMTRPEDARHPTIQAFAGGPITPSSVYAVTLKELVLASTPSGGGSTKALPAARNPGDDVGPTLTGFSGGNLHGSAYGSSAAYGLGEVHLLAFDPTRKPGVDDPWAQLRVVDLARRAHDRRASIVFAPGAEENDSDVTRIRQELDPNENSRWGIAAAALLLCIYAVIAGPISFAAASKKGHPLRALRWLPIFSVGAFLAIVGIGIMAKGVSGRARHVTLIEAGAGMSKGTARRWRGFFASRSNELTVRASDATGVVRSVLTSGGSDSAADHLLVDRDGARLVDVEALPWQTLVIREDAVATLGDGISIVQDGTGAIVKNRSGHDLRAGVLKLPASAIPVYFARIKDGESVKTSAGHELTSGVDENNWTAALGSRVTHMGSFTLHSIAPESLPECFERDAPGLREALGALSAAATDMVDWLPSDVPVLLVQFDGGEGHTRDAGLRLESDRVIVRVVGWGGKP